MHTRHPSWAAGGCLVASRCLVLGTMLVIRIGFLQDSSRITPGLCSRLELGGRWATDVWCLAQCCWCKAQRCPVSLALPLVLTGVGMGGASWGVATGQGGHLYGHWAPCHWAGWAYLWPPGTGLERQCSISMATGLGHWPWC